MSTPFSLGNTPARAEKPPSEADGVLREKPNAECLTLLQHLLRPAAHGKPGMERGGQLCPWQGRGDSLSAAKCCSQMGSSSSNTLVGSHDVPASFWLFMPKSTDARGT